MSIACATGLPDAASARELIDTLQKLTKAMGQLGKINS